MFQEATNNAKLYIVYRDIFSANCMPFLELLSKKMPIDDNFTIQKLTGAKSLICVIGFTKPQHFKGCKKGTRIYIIS